MRYRVVFRHKGFKEPFAGDVLIVEAANERSARKIAREKIAAMVFGPPPRIAWVDAEDHGDPPGATSA